MVLRRRKPSGLMWHWGICLLAMWQKRFFLVDFSDLSDIYFYFLHSRCQLSKIPNTVKSVSDIVGQLRYTVYIERSQMNFQVIFASNGAECRSVYFLIEGTARVRKQDIHSYSGCYQVQFDCVQGQIILESACFLNRFPSCRWGLMGLPVI